MTTARLSIAVGVILDQSGEKVLIAKRLQHLHLGGMWEFPGGKFQAQEPVLEALTRELQEELNITVKQARPLIQIDHDYAEHTVRLYVWLVSAWSGVPGGMEGQEIRWVDRHELSELTFPEANKAIITAVNIPSVYGITPDLPEYGPAFFRKFEKLLRDGLQLVQFRSKGMAEPAQLAVLKKLFPLCNAWDCRLLLNGMPVQEALAYSHGIHLPSADLMKLERRPLAAGYLIGASCHNSHELAHACAVGVDFAVLSPVQATAGHAGIAPLGWQAFADLVTAASIPVYALGGMRKSDVERAQICGAQGVAMIRGLWDG